MTFSAHSPFFWTPSCCSVPAGMINLAVGHPADRLLPRAILSAAASAASLSVGLAGSDVGYGRSAGPLAFCEALAHYLSREHPSPALASELFVTNGASHALDLALGALCAPGDTVFAERPSYFLAGGTLADHRVRVVELPSIAEGLDVDALEARRPARDCAARIASRRMLWPRLNAPAPATQHNARAAPSHMSPRLSLPYPLPVAPRRRTSAQGSCPGRCTSSLPTATPRAAPSRTRPGHGSYALQANSASSSLPTKSTSCWTGLQPKARRTTLRRRLLLQR